MRALTPRGALLLISILVGGCAVAHAPVVASSDPPELIPIHRFFANREANWGYRISPDGVRLGWITSGFRLNIERKYHSMIRRQIEAQLRYEPGTETRNRKPLFRPSVLGSAWELRFGPNNQFRVFYRTDQAMRQVHILAIGIKIRDRLFIGGEEFEL